MGGHGATLVTEDGRSILDFSSLSECSNLGHQHPRVVAAYSRAGGSAVLRDERLGAKPRAQLARELLALAGFEGGRVLFTLAGADANENAVKLARWYTGKPEGRIVARERSYHGATFAAMTLSGDARVKVLPSALPNVAHVPPPYCYRCPWGLSRPSCGIRCADAVAASLADAAGNVAAVIMEPHAGTNGIVAPPEYWPRLRQICDEHGALLIADEVMSAFGRVGEWFAWQRYAEAGRPDLVTLAKGLTGGHVPLGAVLLAPHVAAFFETRMLHTGLTYSGHPLSCAAGVAAVAAYREERLIERARCLGETMGARLRALASRHAAVGDVRGDGAFWVIELAGAALAGDHARASRAGGSGSRARRLVRGARQSRAARAAAPDHRRRARPRLVPPRGAADRNSSDWEFEMAFKLTYSTMFDPPAELHEGFEAGAGGHPRQSRRRACDADRRRRFDARRGNLRERSPIDTRIVLGRFQAGEDLHADAAVAAARRRSRVGQRHRGRSACASFAAPRR